MNLAAAAQGRRWTAEFLTVESQGPEQSQSIMDDLGRRVDCSTAMRFVCLAWLAPAVSLMWIGFASIGLRSVSDADLDRALDLTQAGAILLTIFGSLVGLMWSLRTMEYLPKVRAVGSGSRWFGPWSHLTAAAVGLAAGGVATVDHPLRDIAIGLAVVAGFYALSFVARWVLRVPLLSSSPLALLSLGAGFQVTLGWLHVAHPGGVLSPLLVVEGLALAWMALAAARVVAATGTAVVTDTQAVGADPSALDRLSQAPAQPSLPEPAVGR